MRYIHTTRYSKEDLITEIKRFIYEKGEANAPETREEVLLGEALDWLRSTRTCPIHGEVDYALAVRCKIETTPVGDNVEEVSNSFLYHKDCGERVV